MEKETERKVQRRTAADAVLEEVQTVCVHIHQHTKRVGERDAFPELEHKIQPQISRHAKLESYGVISLSGAKRKARCPTIRN